MSLDRLFEDRKIRKYIRDGVNEAKEVGKGICDCCIEEAYLINAFGKNMCESCAKKAFELADDYDTVMESFSDDVVIDCIKEGYIVVPDMSKVQTAANSKFGGSIPDLMKSYGLGVHKDWDDRLSKSKIFIMPKDHKSGKTRLNQFMIDFGCEFDSASVALSQVADADGTLAPLIVKGQPVQNTGGSNSVSTPSGPKSASMSKATKQSSASSVSTIKAGYIGGNIDHFQIQLGDKEEVDVQYTASTGGVKSFDLSYAGNKININVPEDSAKDFNKLVEYVKKQLVDNPGMLFPSFEGISNGEFEINKYTIYKFAFDENSFSSVLTMVPVYKGVKHPKERIRLTGKALSSVSTLNSELTAYLDTMVRRKYPALVDNKNKFKTSLGVATFELDSIEDSGIVVLDVNIANKKFKGRVDGVRLSTDKDAKDAFAEIILNNIKEFIPDFHDKSIEKKPDNYQIDVDQDNRKFTVYAVYDWNALYDDGDIAFGVSVIDDTTGEEYPKNREKIVIRKAGTKISDFLAKSGMDIHKKYFDNSNMTGTLTLSAQNKLKSPSKKAALMDKIAIEFQKQALKKLGSTKIGDCEVEIDMDVNKLGKPTKVEITVRDPYSDLANDSKELSNILALEKKANWIKVKKVDSVMKDGPAVIYNVTDMQEFGELVRLSILENAILEAFNLVTISESSNRKTFHI